MSATSAAVPDPVVAPGAGQAFVRRRQFAAIARSEVRKNFFRLRGFWVYLLAFAPAVIIGIHALDVVLRGAECTVQQDAEIFAAIFQIYYLRLGIFFGAVGIFTRLFRGEMLERSLHYYLLAPVRRELIVLGKYVAGLAAAAFFFTAGVVLSYALMFGHHGSAGKAYMSAMGWSHLGAYAGVTVLACIGYGALFLLTGMVFRNPVIPAVLLLLWESINHVLPAALKKLSVIFYLEPLCPVEVPLEGVAALFSMSADPIPGWLAIPGVLLVSAVLLLLACLRVRSAEINYTTE